MMNQSDQQSDIIPTKIGIIGLGYVGLPFALLCVKKGFKVLGIDLDEHKIQNLKQGKSYLPDVNDDSIKEAVETGRFFFTDDYDFIQDVDAIIICVPTPLTSFHTPDLSYLQQSAQSISKRIKKGQLIVVESSTYPGTTCEVLVPILEKSHLVVGKDIFIGYSPERIDPGNHLFAVEKIPKIISGISSECLSKIEQLYSQIFEHVVIVSSTKVAEMAKLLENSYRFINISFINEIAMICEQMNIDIWEVIKAAKTKPYGFSDFYPGPGIGGHCIPIDPLYLNWKAKQYGLQSSFIDLSHQINHQISNYIIQKIQQLLSPKKLSDSTIFIYGIAYKKDINDARESPAIDIINKLLMKNAKVQYHDPFVPSFTMNKETIKSVEMTNELLQNADIAIILTDHSKIPLDQIINHSSIVFDTRNITNGIHGKAKIYRFGGGMI